MPYVPGLQGTQALGEAAPVMLEDVPRGHAEHAVEAGCGAKYPGAHAWHEPAPLPPINELAEPAGQARHAAELVLPTVTP